MSINKTFDSEKSAVKIDLQQIKELLGIVSSTDVTELTIEFGDQKITVKKEKQAPTTIEIPMGQMMTQARPAVSLVDQAAPQPVAANAPAPAPVKVEAVTSSNHNEDNGTPANTVAITSPMVGTFYRITLRRQLRHLCKVGDRVSVGQTVCIIEAMKLMNDLPSEVAGKIVKICVENGTTVEYGQTLYLVDPKG
jgi:acetyl-CoA carboxylase biotin carboxyl carrier protein